MLKLLKNALVLNDDFSIARRNLLIKDKYIEKISETPIENINIDIEVNLEGHVVFPALINSHDHLIDTGWKKMGVMPVNNWYEWDASLKDCKDFNLMQRLSSTDLYLCGMYKNAVSGTVTVFDHFPHEISNAFTDHPLVSLIRYYFAAHSPSKHSLQWCSDLASAYKKTMGIMPFIVHVAEGRSQELGKETELLKRMGVLASNTILADCAFLDEDAIEIVANSGASISWVPLSSQNIFEKQPPIKKIMDCGIPICIGTDASITGSSSLHEEFKFIKQYSKENLNNRLSAKDILKMVTSTPAKLFRIDKETGSITKGKLANFIIFKQNSENPENLAEDFLNLEPALYSMVIHKGNMIIGDHEFRPLTFPDSSKYSEIWFNGLPKLIMGRPLQLLERIAFKLEKQVVYPFFDITSGN
ncbi:MAG: amidohydrolase family protein [Candidatus Riflebacteria bacterium]|nr:amidohydrolase family protein [Candidatus Riflebacteria bacterium]